MTATLFGCAGDSPDDVDAQVGASAACTILGTFVSGAKRGKGIAAMPELLPRREYSSPPVVEAICQVTFAEPVPWSVATPGLLFSAIQSEYPAQPEAQSPVEATFRSNPSSADQTEVLLNQGTQRFVFADATQSRRLVANHSCLSVNALPPYETWPHLVDRFRTALERFQEAVTPFVPAMLSLRYINQIKIPLTAFMPDEYFNIPVLVVHQPNAALFSFLSRAQARDTETKIQTTVTFGSIQHPVDDESAFVLDIELQAPVPNEFSVDELIKTIDDLHRLENHEFESSITERCRELFE